MHPSSINNMIKARNHKKVSLGSSLKILDVGGRTLDSGFEAGSDRSYKKVFEDITEVYHTADIVKGTGVTHVMPGPYTLPMEDNTYDLIVSGQTLEHVRNPFRSVAEMTRVLKPNGWIILIAPSAGPRHDKVDCWRFMDDSFRAIAKESGLIPIADWIDHNAPDERSAKWKDHVFVGRKPHEE